MASMRQIILTRDSVCAADDVASPHQQLISVTENNTLKEILQTVLRLKYIPVISGGKASWSVHAPQPVAVISQSWKEPRLINGKIATIKELFFKYHQQKDPDQLFQELIKK